MLAKVPPVDRPQLVTVTTHSREIVPMPVYEPGLGEQAYRAMIGGRAARGLKADATVVRFPEAAPGVDVDRRSAAVLRRLSNPFSFRNMDFLRLRARVDVTVCRPEFRHWLRIFRKRIDERRIPLFETGLTGSSAEYAFWESAGLTAGPHHGGRVRELGKAEWSVIGGIALETARACEVCILWDEGQPALFALGDDLTAGDGSEGSIFDPMDFAGAGFVTDGPGFDRNGQVIADYVSKEGWRWFGREPKE